MARPFLVAAGQRPGAPAARKKDEKNRLSLLKT